MGCRRRDRSKRPHPCISPQREKVGLAPSTPTWRLRMSRHVVARVEEIPPGGRKIIRVAGREVGIFNLEGRYYALKNSCPHQGSRVCLGRIVGTTLPSDVYEYRY